MFLKFPTFTLIEMLFLVKNIITLTLECLTLFILVNLNECESWVLGKQDNLCACLFLQQESSYNLKVLERQGLAHLKKTKKQKKTKKKTALFTKPRPHGFPVNLFQSPPKLHMPWGHTKSAILFSFTS